MVIRGRKPGFSSVDIDMRLAGTSAWTNIGIKLNHFPFIDTIAPQVPGKPEKREYRAPRLRGRSGNGSTERYRDRALQRLTISKLNSAQAARRGSADGLFFGARESVRTFRQPTSALT